MPSANANLNNSALVVQFASGSLRPGSSVSFVVDNIENPRTPQYPSNLISAALIGITASGLIATDNTNEGSLSRITPSISDLDVKLNSSVAGAFVTATISFSLLNSLSVGSFVITLSGFSVAAGQNLTVAFSPNDGLGIRLGEGFVCHLWQQRHCTLDADCNRSSKLVPLHFVYVANSLS
jgi:hypothetical protein